jgi:hypothetical protein
MNFQMAIICSTIWIATLDSLPGWFRVVMGVSWLVFAYFILRHETARRPGFWSRVYDR